MVEWPLAVKLDDMIPVVPHHKPNPAQADVERADGLAAELARRCPELALPPDYAPMVPERIGLGGTLHVDDLSEISLLDAGQDTRFYQERARLRAVEGDTVATVVPVARGYEDYYRDVLGLGAVEWLHPAPPHGPSRVAESLWEDRAVRERLIAK